MVPTGIQRAIATMVPPPPSDTMRCHKIAVVADAGVFYAASAVLSIRSSIASPSREGATYVKNAL